MTMTYKPFICVVVFILFSISNPLSGFSKTPPQMAKLEKINKPDSRPTNYKRYLKKSHNELEATKIARARKWKAGQAGNVGQ